MLKFKSFILSICPIILLIFAVNSCKAPSQSSDVNGYFHEGEQYAYGATFLEEPVEAHKLMLKKNTGVNEIDSEDYFKLVDKDNSEVQYVDYLPNSRRPVIYNSKIITRPAEQDPDLTHIWFKLSRPSPSYSDPATTYIYVGNSRIEGSSSGVNLFSKVTLSKISLGTKKGSMALHYADPRIRGKKYDPSFCYAALEMSERERSDIVGGYNPIGCVDASKHFDICDGSPTECIPEIPSRLKELQSSDSTFQLMPQGMKKISSESPSYRLVGDEELVFINIHSSDRESSANGCENFNISVRDSENRLSDSCSAQIDKVISLREGHCSVKVVFSNANSFHDKVCHVVVHDLTNDKTDVAQLLAR